MESETRQNQLIILKKNCVVPAGNFSSRRCTFIALLISQQQLQQQQQ
jgi:hypothetical protein